MRPPIHRLSSGLMAAVGLALVVVLAVHQGVSRAGSSPDAVCQPPAPSAGAPAPGGVLRSAARDVRAPAADLRGRGSTPTLTVAAANTPPDKRALADFVCDGVHDEVEIQAALDTFGDYQSSPWGGTVDLMRGIYYIGAPISFRGARTLRGEGVRGTVLWLADGANCNLLEYRVRPNQSQKENFSYIEALYLYGNKAHNTVGNGIYAQRSDPNHPSQNLGLWDATLRDVNIMSFAENGVYLEEIWGWVIDSVIVEFCGLRGMYLQGACGKITNCKMIENVGCGLFLYGVGGLLATNLEIDSGTGSIGYAALTITHSNEVHVVNCAIDSAISGAVWLRGNTHHCSLVGVNVPLGASSTSLKLSALNDQSPFDNSFSDCDFSTSGIPVSDAGMGSYYANNRGFVTEKSSARQVVGSPSGATVFVVPHGLDPHMPPSMTRHFQILPTNGEMAVAQYYVSNPDPDGTGTLVEITFVNPPPVRAILTFDLLARFQHSD